MIFSSLFQKKGQNKKSRITQLIERLFYTPLGQALISILFGLALAFMFQKVCKGKKCVLIESPPIADLNGHYYRVGKDDEVCYEYVPRIVACSDDEDDEDAL